MKIKDAVYVWAVLAVSAVLICSCRSTQENTDINKDEPMILDTTRFKGKVKAIEENKDDVVYEYSDIRIDQVSVLATMYCNQKGSRRAYLDKVNLYKNNARRAKFFCVK